MRKLCLVIAAGMLLWACGGDAKETPREARQQAQQQEPAPAGKQKLPADQLRYEAALRDAVNARIAELEGTPEPGTNASLREQAVPMRAMSRFMLAVSRDFAKVEPPQEVRVAHAAYVDANRKMAGVVARVARAMMREDRRAVQQLVRELSSGKRAAAREMQAARADFAALGYRLPGEMKPGEGASPTGAIRPGEGRVPVPPDTG